MEHRKINPIKKLVSKNLTIRAYCSLCNGLILESNAFTRKELKAKWDVAVMEAPLALKCQACAPDAKINFDMSFKIFNSNTGTESPVSSYIKDPKLF